mmetsp:Transcript_36916/g.114731  ORF Transcript_36916/g.114731 Transcript_36916/m.114731 type:complete len:235 (+) Transcript_36916:995-1699(+)
MRRCRRLMAPWLPSSRRRGTGQCSLLTRNPGFDPGWASTSGPAGPSAACRPSSGGSASTHPPPWGRRSGRRRSRSLPRQQGSISLWHQQLGRVKAWPHPRRHRLRLQNPLLPLHPHQQRRCHRQRCQRQCQQCRNRLPTPQGGQQSRDQGRSQPLMPATASRLQHLASRSCSRGSTAKRRRLLAVARPAAAAEAAVSGAAALQSRASARTRRSRGTLEAVPAAVVTGHSAPMPP